MTKIKSNFLFILIPGILLSIIFYTAFIEHNVQLWEYLVGSARAKLSFYDLRSLRGLIFSIRDSLDPYYNNPYDPSGRVLNYPPIWIKISHLFQLDKINNFNSFAFFLTGSSVLAVTYFFIRNN